MQERQAPMTQDAHDRPVMQRTNAPQPKPETRPQRRPRFSDTPWGRLRESTGWSIRETARRTGVNTADLSRIERGLAPTPDQARLLLAAYQPDAIAGLRVTGAEIDAAIASMWTNGIMARDEAIVRTAAQAAAAELERRGR
jgi:transcriptional regulator with XRE-family HTH domain